MQSRHQFTPTHGDRAAPADQRGWLTRRIGLSATAVAAAGLAGAAAFLILTDAGHNARRATPLIAELDRIATRLGFGIAEVRLQGHRYTLDRDIYRALDLTSVGSQISFDAAAAGNRIEQLTWVKSALVRRILPDGLAIDIVERKPVAVWQYGNRKVLIDDEGRELAVIAATNIGLPVVSGAGAAATAADILALMARHRPLADRVREARRISDRRWTLVLTHGTQLHLPADGADAAVSRLLARAPSLIVSRALADIDLRTPGRLIVRRAAPRDHARLAGAALSSALATAAVPPRATTALVNNPASNTR